jgi:hypothetical protein
LSQNKPFRKERENMADFTPEEIAHILQAAELLRAKKSTQKINIQQFCHEAGISRKNAYKHKNNRSPEKLNETIAELQKAKTSAEEQLRLALLQAEQADVYKRLFDLSVAIRVEVKKNKNRLTVRRKKLIDEFNGIAAAHGIKLLNY